MFSLQGILWVLWLASAALSASNISGADCDINDYFFVPSWFVTGCGEAKAITAFGPTVLTMPQCLSSTFLHLQGLEQFRAQ